jgi:hypothetical protein
MAETRRSSLTRALSWLVVGLVVAGVALMVRQLDWRAKQRPPAEEERREKLVLVRVEAKVRIIEELLAGRMDLLRAAALFSALNHRPPEFDWEEFRLLHTGESDEERHCRQVIAWVHGQLGASDPCAALAACDRLEGQLDRHLRAGTLVFPVVELPPVVPAAND